MIESAQWADSMKIYQAGPKLFIRGIQMWGVLRPPLVVYL